MTIEGREPVDLAGTDPVRHIEFAVFRDRLTRFVFGDEAVAIDEGGQVVGFFIPAPAISPAAREAMADLEAALREAEARGISEAELRQLFAPSEAVPNAPRR